jgi:signal transduction histidine kinase/serine phosphatase RsbU (regulator of sigma subunit)/DNA-binding response OmpR family regulator
VTGTAAGRHDGSAPAGQLADDRAWAAYPQLAAAFADGGEMGRRLRELDWSATGLGGPRRWSASLRHTLAMLLASRSQIVVFWGEDHLAFYNDAYRPTIGDKHPAALGRPARLGWAELWDVLGPLLDDVRRAGRAFHAVDHPFLIDRHGFLEQVYFDVSYDPVRGEDGRVEGIYCVVSETTGRVLGERRLRALAELGTRLARPAELASRADLAARAARVLDDHRDDVPFALVYLADGGTAGHSGVDPDLVRPGVPPAVAAVLDGGPATGVEVTDLLTAVPERVAADALVLPLTAAAEPVGALVVGVDDRLPLTDDYRDFLDLVAGQISTALTNHDAYEYEHRRAAELADLDRAKTNFFANVSHEFRTPLTLVLGPLEQALADPELPRRFRHDLQVMHRNGMRLLKLVNTVLDFSRLESGRMRAYYQPTDLSGYTARLASTFRSAAERAGLRLVVDCPPLPEPVLVDRDLWEKVVLNLLSNAVKFTFDGEVTVRVRAVDRTARLEVADTGVGIEPDELPRVFDRFHRVAGVRARTHEGTGIGLALVRELVELHGGTVDVRSEVDRGSVFGVTVPFGVGHLPADRVASGADPVQETGQARLYVAETSWWPVGSPGEARPAVGGTPTRTGRVLVADDNSDLRDHVTGLLSPYWEVVAVPDGAAAFAAAVASPFDLVLTDLMMPRLDGVGLVTGLRADPRTRHVPIVILSARAGAGDAIRGLAAGADDYLVKPFAAEELVARVRSNLELGQLRGRIINQLRALADAAVAVNTARTTAEVVEVAARHALALAEAGRVVASVPGTRFEADAGGSTADHPASVSLVGTTGERLGELQVWARQGAADDTGGTALAQLGRLVGVRLENARLHEAEHRIATTLQHSLLPESLPRLPGAVVAGRYLSGAAEVEVGGDWYDAITVGEELVLVVGDVVGKGVAAAAAMGQLRNALRAYLLEGFDPGYALTRLNRLVDSTGRRSFATVACLSLHPVTGRLRYASAGHPAPLVIRPGTGVEFLHDRALGPPVGALAEAAYPTATDRLAPGSRLLLYTDGLIEERGRGVDVGLTRLRADAGAAYDHVEDLVDGVLAAVTGRHRADDVTVLAVEVAEPDRLRLRLAADPTSLAVLRRRLQDFLAAHRVGEQDVFDLLVAVSEAAANAIEHPVAPSAPVITVEATVDERAVTVVVRDTGGWRAATGAGFRGRGLDLIRALAELTVDRTPEGTSVTLRRPLTP